MVLYYTIVSLDFHGVTKMIFGVYLKKTQAIGLQLMLNPCQMILVHGMPWQCLFALSISVPQPDETDHDLIVICLWSRLPCTIFFSKF
jgi:hypothetical protein